MGRVQAPSGSDPSLDGRTLSSRGDVVVVAINYRLGTMGLLALDDGHTNGNYALSDMITALDWVRAHIKDFGGDPDRITIFGQSSGAISVMAMIASPKTIGKFPAAISQSYISGNFQGGKLLSFAKYYDIQYVASTTSAAILQPTNCSDVTEQLDCLRAVPAYTLSDLALVSYDLVSGVLV